jgi:hypothetical protein
MAADRAGGDREPQREQKHPDEWERDLNPDYMEGQNIGAEDAERERNVRSAYDRKDVHRHLADAFTDDELKRIPVLPEGERLQQGATYLDLAGQRPHEFTALGDMSAGEGNRYVPKDEVPYPLWNRLSARRNRRAEPGGGATQPPRRSARPGRAPVAAPSRTTGTPLTSTCWMPTEVCTGSSKVARSQTVFGSKSVRSA